MCGGEGEGKGCPLTLHDIAFWQHNTALVSAVKDVKHYEMTFMVGMTSLRGSQ